MLRNDPNQPRARQRSALRPAAGALLLAWLAHAGLAAEPDDALVRETELKAAFIYNFTKFVEWPPAAVAAKGSPIVIAILGETPLTTELGVIVQGRKVNGHPIVVTTFDAEPERASQILFVTATEDRRFAALPTSYREGAVLTVGESPAFAAAGGAIAFVRQDGKLRFEINISAAERAHLKVSGELQKLAAAVVRSP